MGVSGNIINKKNIVVVCVSETKINKTAFLKSQTLFYKIRVN